MSPLVKTILTLVVIFIGILTTYKIYEYASESHFQVAFTGGVITILIALTIAEK